MSYLPYASGLRGWIPAGLASTLFHVALIAGMAFTYSDVLRQLFAAETDAGPQFQITLEQLDSDTLAGVVERDGVAGGGDTGAQVAALDPVPEAGSQPAAQPVDPVGGDGAAADGAAPETLDATTAPETLAGEQIDTAGLVAETVTAGPVETLGAATATADDLALFDPAPETASVAPVETGDLALFNPEPATGADAVAPVKAEELALFSPEPVTPSAAPVRAEELALFNPEGEDAGGAPVALPSDQIDLRPVLPDTPAAAPLPADTGEVLAAVGREPPGAAPLPADTGEDLAGSTSGGPGDGSAPPLPADTGAAPGALGSGGSDGASAPPLPADTGQAPATVERTTITAAPLPPDNGADRLAAVSAEPAVTPGVALPADPATPTPAAAPAPPASAQDLAISDLLRRIRAAPPEPCLIALPRRDGPDGVGLALIGASDAAMEAFSSAVLTAEDGDIRQTRSIIDSRQCAAVDFVHENRDYPATRLAIRIDNPTLASGERLTGILRGSAGRNLTVLVIDDNGVVQDMQRFLSFSGNLVRFDVPVTRDGPARDTWQMLLAFATAGRPTAIQDKLGHLAEDVFTGDGAALGVDAAMAVAMFDVR